MYICYGGLLFGPGRGTKVRYLLANTNDNLVGFIAGEVDELLKLVAWIVVLP